MLKMTRRSAATGLSDDSSSSSRSLRLLPAVCALCLAAVTVFVTGCKEGDPVGMGDVDASKTPTMMTRNVETLISDSGVTRFRIVTPIWYVYDEVDEPYWRFPEGLNLDKYDNFFRREATVVADSAYYLKNKQIWRLDGNVTINNVMGEKFLTNQLFWDQRMHKLYSDSFIHIERPDKVLEGYGFDSNEQLTRYTIRKVSGIFPAGAFKPGSRQERAAGGADEGEEDGAEAAAPAQDNDSIKNTGSR